MASDLGNFLGLCLIFLYFGVLIFLVTLLWRITIALEKMARHQLEMSRDIKRVADATDARES